MIHSLSDALQLIRKIEPNVRKFGYFTLLGGSILYKGESTNDIDIYLLPVEDSRIHNDHKSVFGYLIREFDITLAGSGYPDGDSLRTIWKSNIDGKKIDFFLYDFGGNKK